MASVSPPLEGDVNMPPKKIDPFKSRSALKAAKDIVRGKGPFTKESVLGIMKATRLDLPVDYILPNDESDIGIPISRQDYLPRKLNSIAANYAKELLSRRENAKKAHERYKSASEAIGEIFSGLGITNINGELLPALHSLPELSWHASSYAESHGAFAGLPTKRHRIRDAEFTDHRVIEKLSAIFSDLQLLQRWLDIAADQRKSNMRVGRGGDRRTIEEFKDLLFSGCIAIYQAAFKVEAGTSTNPHTGASTGPLVRYLKEVLSVIGVTLSAPAIRAHVRSSLKRISLKRRPR